MAAGIRIRQTVLADLDELAALFDQYRQFQGQAADLAAARAFLQQRFERGESTVFVADDDEGRAVGFAQLYPSFSSVALARVFVLNDLFVHPSARRRGVAAALLSAVEAHGFALGAVRITLNVARDNAPALRLYEALGWQRDQQFHMLHRFRAAG